MNCSKYFLFRNHIFLILLVSTLMITSCTDSIRIMEINGGYSDNNPIIIDVKVELSDVSTAFVKYWSIEFNDTLTTELSHDKTSHTFLLTHLVSDREYNYKVFFSDGEKYKSSDVYSFKTGSLPYTLPKFDLVQGDKSVFDGYIMVRKMTDPGAQIMLNSNGDVVWYQMSDSALFRPFYITSENSYLALKATDEIIEMDIYGDTLLTLTKGINDFNRDLHHEIYKNEEGLIFALTKEEKEFDFTAFGGTANDMVVGDGILVLDSLGNKIWSWNIFDVMDPEITEELYKRWKDWSHGNALSQDIDGNYLVSFRNFNQIWKINASDGSVIWKLGDNGDFVLNDDEYFIGQHTVHINPRGEMMLFDNTVEETKSSRAIAFTIDENQMTAKSTLVVDLPDSLYSFKQGSVYFIEEDKLMFCSSMAKSIAITNLEGEIIWQVNSEQSFYRAEYIR